MSAPYFTLPEFDYVRPKSLEEALKILEEKGEEAKIFNGGIGILGFMKERMLEANLLVDIKGIKELKRIEYIPGKGLIVGATVTANELIEWFDKNPDVREKFRAVYESTKKIADAILRNKATIVGNILEGLSYTDAPAAALIFDAELHAVSLKGDRWIPVDGAVMGPGMTVLEPNEIVTEILYKEPPEGAKSGYVKFAYGSEYGLVNVAALVANLDEPEKRIVRIAISSATPLPYRARSAEEVFKKPGRFTDLVDEAVKKIQEEAEFMDEPHVSAEYRRYLTGILVTKLLIQLARR